MTFSRRHTQNEILTAIDFMEARGWTINADGTITNAKLQVKRVRCDSRLKNAEPRYATMLPNGRQATIKRVDILAAKFGLAVAEEQPDEVEVGLRLNLEPETCPEPAREGSCGHCGGFMAHIRHVGEPAERKCVQCGRADTPTRTLSAAETKELRERRAARGEAASRTRRWISKADAELEKLVQPSRV